MCLLIVLFVLRVHEVKVEVVDLAERKLLHQKRADVLLLLEIRLGQLIRQEKALARITG